MRSRTRSSGQPWPPKDPPRFGFHGGGGLFCRRGRCRRRCVGFPLQRWSMIIRLCTGRRLCFRRSIWLRFRVPAHCRRRWAEPRRLRWWRGSYRSSGGNVDHVYPAWGSLLPVRFVFGHCRAMSGKPRRGQHDDQVRDRTDRERTPCALVGSRRRGLQQTRRSLDGGWYPMKITPWI